MINFNKIEVKENNISKGLKHATQRTEEHKGIYKRSKHIKTRVEMERGINAHATFKTQNWETAVTTKLQEKDKEARQTLL